MNPLIKTIMTKMVQNNPNVAGNPRNKALLDTLASGDKDRIRQTVENLCQTYGCSVEEAGNAAIQWFQDMVNQNK